jgi:hypothetical protein
MPGVAQKAKCLTRWIIPGNNTTGISESLDIAIIDLGYAGNNINVLKLVMSRSQINICVHLRLSAVKKPIS